MQGQKPTKTYLSRDADIWFLSSYMYGNQSNHIVAICATTARQTKQLEQHRNLLSNSIAKKTTEQPKKHVQSK
jgi:hypothetical protein